MAKKSDKKEIISKPSVRPGIVILAALVLFIGVTGWYVLEESSRIQDEYDKIDAGNNTILRRVTPSEDPVN
ncbi:MAG: hypothetical protein AAF413_01295 [Patescibacteria group bacterium]